MRSQQRQQNTAIHYKLYKKKKLWMTAALAGIVSGLAITTSQASADTNQSADQQPDNQIANSLPQDNQQQQLQQSQYRLQASQQAAAQPQDNEQSTQQADHESDGLSLSVNHPDYNPLSGTGQTITFSAGGVAGKQTIQAGDTVTITIPCGIYKLGEVQSIPVEYGHTEYTQVGDNHVIIDTFAKVPSQVFKQSVTLLPISYRYGMDLRYGISDFERWFAKEKQVTAKVSDGRETDISFNQIITPRMNPQMTRRTPAGGNGRPALLVNTDYEWQINLNEESGLYGDFANEVRGKSFVLERFNGSVNSKGTITIPVPDSFVLNEAATKARINDKNITVTQAGKGQPVIITDTNHLGGHESWDDETPPYIFVGRFEMAQPEKNVEVHFGSNENPITIHQELHYDLGTVDGTTKWTDTILGRTDDHGNPQGQGPVVEQIDGRVRGYQRGDDSNSNLDNLPLDHDTARELNHISFQNNNPQDLHNAVATIDVPDGLNVDSFRVPQIGAVNEFAYTVTFVDGTSTSGKIKAGQQTEHFAKPIAKIKLSLPTWPMGAGTGNVSTYFGVYQGGLVLYGTVARTYRKSNEEVKVDDQLTTKLTITADNLSQPKVVTGTQKLIAPQNIKMASLEVEQTKWGPGYTKAGHLRLKYGDGNDKTAAYFVLPENAVLAPGTEKRRGVTVFQANGRTIVKVTQAGSSNNYYYTVYLDNTKPAIASNKLIKVYLYTGDDQIKLISSFTRDEYEKVADADLPFVEGHQDAYLVSKETVGGQRYWRVMPTNATGIISGAEGNKDSMPVAKGHSDDHGDPAMTFHSQIINTSMNTLTNVVSVVNLPDKGFRFNLTGPARAVDEFGNVIQNAEIRYGLSPVDIHVSTGHKNDVTGFVTADQINDWSKVRSVAIIIPRLANSDIIDLELPGQDPSLPEDAGKTAALASVTTATELNDPFIIEAGGTASASITVSGQSTVKARFHYQDDNGQDQYITLDDLSKTYQDNQDTMQRQDFPANANDFSSGDLAKIPAGYHLAATEPTVINSGHGPYANNYADGTAEFDKQVKYYYDGDIIQYELIKDGQPETPEKPYEHPDTPTPPEKPDDHPDTPTPSEKPVEPTTPTTSSQPVAHNEKTAQQLPQTGNTKKTGLLGLAVTMILGALGLAGKDSKRRS